MADIAFNPNVFNIRIHNLNFDLELIPVVCFRTQMRIMCDSMTIELKLMNHEAVDLKSVVNVSRRQLRKLKRIVSKSHRILLEVSDRTDHQVELITLRTTMFGHSDVPQSSIVETMIESQTRSPPSHLYPTLPPRRGSLQ